MIGEGEARDYRYAGVETGKARGSGCSCAETRCKLVDGVLGQKGGDPPPPPEGHWTTGVEGGAGQEYLCNNKRWRLGFGGVTVRGWNSNTS